MRRESLALLAALLAGCTTQPAPGEQMSCGQEGPFTYYFPAGTFVEVDPGPGLEYEPYDDLPTREWRTESLTQLEQTSLYCGAARADETYRLLWDRAFHENVAIEVSRTGGNYQLHSAVANIKTSTGKPLIRQRRALSFDEWQQIKAGIASIDFWNLPPNNNLPSSVYDPATNLVTVRTSGKDGAQWTIEARTDRYHVVDRWTQDYDVTAVGRIFIALANLGIPEEDIY